MGGKQANSTISSKIALKLDIFNMKWTRMPDMAVARYKPGCFRAQNHLYVFSGAADNDFENEKYGSVEKFDLKSEKWEILAFQNEKLMQNHRGIEVLPLFRNQIFYLNLFDDSIYCLDLEK